MRTVFGKLNFEEQIMSKDIYVSFFSRQMAAGVFVILQIFFATRVVLKIKLGYFPVVDGAYTVT